MLKKIIALSVIASIFSFANFAQAKMTLKSQSIAENKMLKNDQVFSGFGCTGKNISPQLSWSGAPAETKSYAIMAYDPDAPTGSGWWHWVAFNIPKDTNSVAENFGASDHEGIIQSRTDFGTYGFGGACPPVGDKAHRYKFTVYALKTDKLPLDKDASAAMVGYMVRANAIDSATITAKYGR